LHSIFEKANFEHKNFSAYLNYSFKGNIKKEHFTGYSKLMEQVLSADFNGFNLLDLPNHLRLNEFEYHLKINENSSISSITGLFNDKYRSDENISGLLNGFIDMIFEKDGKYYLLDWKSNYLGNTLDAYKRKNLDIAIQSNNYDLQYHLYTVALCSYLKQNIAEFDFDKHFGGGFWVFLRGCRAGEKNGICFFEPDKEKFDSMSKILG
jgi:exodeoxyribonuclease V beta subunit